jgi:nucleotide-binding universal stress UspA family protein
LSENSSTALTWALKLADKFGAKVVLFHTAGDIAQMVDIAAKSQLGDQGWHALKKKIEHDAINIMKKRVEHVCAEAPDDIPSCPFLVEEIVVKRGYPVDKILCEAEDKNCDVVVMGTHDKGKLAKALTGSTARRVLRRCKKPVFVIPLPSAH